jgi:hypothetical protein
MNKVFNFKLAKEEFLCDILSKTFSLKLKLGEDLEELNCDQVLAASKIYRADFDEL